MIKPLWATTTTVLEFEHGLEFEGNLESTLADERTTCSSTKIATHALSCTAAKEGTPPHSTQVSSKDSCLGMRRSQSPVWGDLDKEVVLREQITWKELGGRRGPGGPWSG